MSFTEVPAGKLAAIVTSLEMFARPPARPERSDNDFLLEQVIRPDLAWFRELFRRVGEKWIWVSRLRMSDTDLAAIIRDPSVEVFVLRSGAAEAGLLELDFRTADECELSFFGLTGDFVGSGAGRWLMNRAIARAWSRPIRRFWVHTCTFDHQDAPAFYVRSGFRACRRQIELMDDPRLAGLLPRTAAPHIPIIE
jgi:GNAT superfamily N-acetyltransferase